MKSDWSHFPNSPDQKSRNLWHSQHVHKYLCSKSVDEHALRNYGQTSDAHIQFTRGYNSLMDNSLPHIHNPSMVAVLLRKLPCETIMAYTDDSVPTQSVYGLSCGRSHVFWKLLNLVLL
ncbi:hypothetical protein PNOK_0202300 [Pyrrhoderma noxium]|uniref:Uncharacterized protein n=1 Tax=Pyrrhoderma noxium TaxID=2282107 RepID=A0A286UR42_9AGAM|nr:hypothetical protein PNOK_0202300 [Pyrrhoderma noxium]